MSRNIVSLQSYRKLRSTGRSPSLALLMLKTRSGPKAKPKTLQQAQLPQCDTNNGEWYAAVSVAKSQRAAGLKPKDVLVFYMTDDVTSGDFIYITHKGKVQIGTARFTEAWIHLDEPCGCHVHSVSRYDESDFEIIGRLVEVQRDDQPVEASLPMRPLSA